MSPTLDASSALQHFERSNTVKIRNWNDLRYLPGTATYIFYNNGVLLQFVVTVGEIHTCRVYWFTCMW